MITVLVAGDDAYAFDDFEAAAVQYTVLVGANADVTCHQVPESKWDGIRAELLAVGPDVTVVESFKAGVREYAAAAAH